MDPRAARSRDAIHASIGRLASARPLGEITVSDIAEDARMSRATFYRHFSSPTEAAEDLLRTDLDARRAENFRIRRQGLAPPEAAFRSALTAAADHVERFRPLYATALTDPTHRVTHHLLAEHFTETVRQLLEHPAAPPPEIDRAVAARFLAHGIVGGLEAWVDAGSISRNELVRTLLLSVPAWWLTI